jgi:plasmid segregation protein ParM
MDEDFYKLTLMGVACELNRAGMREADVHLAAGLPLTWVRKQRESFREYLLRNERAEYRYNGKDYRVRFVGCSVYPQGYAAVINSFGSLKGTNLLADIGNGTMNVLYIVDRRPMEDRSWTEKLGVNQCMIQAKNAVMDNFGLKIDDSIVEQVLRTGTADIAGKYLDCITTVAKKYTTDIFAALRKYEYDPALVRLMIVGGGGCLVRHFGEYDETRVTIIDDLCATAKGYETLASSSLRRRDRP